MIGSGTSSRRWLNCNVFVGATERIAPRGEKRTSEHLTKRGWGLAISRRVWGTKLDIRKKEKKATMKKIAWVEEGQDL